MLFAGAKPIAVMTVAYAYELSGELGDNRSLPGLYKAPARGGGHAGQLAPVPPPVDMIKREILGFGHLHHRAFALQVIADTPAY